MEPTSMTADYDVNSTHQRAANFRNIEDFYEALKSFAQEKVITVADIASATGLNSMKVFSRALTRLKEESQAQVMIHHVDVPTNEWSVLFRNYNQEEESYRHTGNAYCAGIGGSMYTRLFPDEYLNVVYSTSTLHWLSKKIVPQPNISEEEVKQLSFAQSQIDLEQFLTLRHAELKPLGRILIRTSTSMFARPAYQFSLSRLKSEGRIPSNIVLSSYSAVYHRSVAEYLEVIQRLSEKFRVVNARTERHLHPLWDRSSVSGDEETIAERKMMEVKSPSATTIKLLFKTLGVDADLYSQLLFGYIKEYFLTNTEPVYTEEVFIILEKLP